MINKINETYAKRFRDAEFVAYSYSMEQENSSDSSCSDYLVALMKKIKKVKTLPVLHKSRSSANLISCFPGAAGCIDISLLAKWRVNDGFTEAEIDVIHKDLMGRAAPLLQIRKHIANLKELDVVNKLAVPFVHQIHRYFYIIF